MKCSFELDWLSELVDGKVEEVFGGFGGAFAGEDGDAV